jgi:hypothetical protein
MPAGKNQFRIVNLWSVELLGIAGSSTVIQGADDGSADRLWQIVEGVNGNVKIHNVSSGLVIASEAGSRAVQRVNAPAASSNWPLRSASVPFRKVRSNSPS